MQKNGNSRALHNKLVSRSIPHSFSSPNFNNRDLPRMPPNAFQRVDEWNRTAGHGFSSYNGHGERFQDGSSVDGYDFSRAINSGGEVSIYDDDVTPWDSVSMTSSRSAQPRSERGFRLNRMYGSATDLRHHSKDFSQQRGSRIEPGSGGDCESPSARLLSCMESLDYLTKKLDDVNMVVNEAEKFRSASMVLTPVKFLLLLLYNSSIKLCEVPGRVKKVVFDIFSSFFDFIKPASFKLYLIVKMFL